MNITGPVQPIDANNLIGLSQNVVKGHLLRGLLRHSDYFRLLEHRLKTSAIIPVGSQS